MLVPTWLQLTLTEVYVRFVHFSVQEFLTSHRPATLSMGQEVGHREIVQACMIFLTLFPNGSGLRWLYQYAVDEWPHHLLAGNLNSLLVHDRLVTLTSSFFGTSPVLLTKQPKQLEGCWSERKEMTYLKLSPPVLALMFNLPGTHGMSRDSPYGLSQLSPTDCP